MAGTGGIRTLVRLQRPSRWAPQGRTTPTFFWSTKSPQSDAGAATKRVLLHRPNPRRRVRRSPQGYPPEVDYPAVVHDQTTTTAYARFTVWSRTADGFVAEEPAQRGTSPRLKELQSRSSVKCPPHMRVRNAGPELEADRRGDGERLLTFDTAAARHHVNDRHRYRTPRPEDDDGRDPHRLALAPVDPARHPPRRHHGRCRTGRRMK